MSKPKLLIVEGDPGLQKQLKWCFDEYDVLAAGTRSEAISALRPGRMLLAGETWSAEPYDESLTIEPGATVEVLEIRGATAYVHPVHSLGS